MKSPSYVKFAIAALTITACFSVSTQAADPVNSTTTPSSAKMEKKSAQKPAEAASPFSTGEVNKIDKGTGKITITHGPLANLGMPATTTVFLSQDAAMLDDVKTGDKVNFVAEKLGSRFLVTTIKLAK